MKLFLEKSGCLEGVYSWSCGWSKPVAQAILAKAASGLCV
jgi:hypothetical protein